jgi:uncharacterized cupredoxin-like copper-binding protein
MNKLTIRAFCAGAIAALVLSIVPLAGAAAHGTTFAERTSAVTVNVKAGEFFYTLSLKSIPKPEAVTFVVKNVGHVLHDFKIDGKTTPLLQPGTTAKLTVSFTKKARYPYLCTVPGHAAAGMKGVFTVS